jgi:hypothetical protein
MKAVFDWEKRGYRREIYYVKDYINNKNNYNDVAVEINKASSNTYAVYVNFKNKELCNFKAGFKTLEDAKKFADECLDEAGIKTLGDEYRMLL